jgi:hypothetical protein
LIEPALGMLLSPEGATLRGALVADLLNDPELAARRLEELAPLVSSDPSLSGRRILDRLVAFLLSSEGEETRGQLLAGIRSNGNGGVDLVHIVDLASAVGRLHPEFGAGTLIRSVGGYLLSEAGKPARNQLLVAGAQRLTDGVLGQLSRLARPPTATPPASSPPPTAILVEGATEKRRPSLATSGQAQIQAGP